MLSSFIRVLPSRFLLSALLQTTLVSTIFMGTALADTDKQNSPGDFYNLSLAELGQVQISIATGNSTPLDKAPATASVIYASEIEAMGARTLDDVLETVPGLHVSLSSLSRLDSVYSIRGIHTGFNPQVLLLMNGVPVQYSAQGGRPTLFRLPVASIDRVEVIRGPGSAIYGADAYSGVINVITKDAGAIETTQAGARTGSFGSRDLWLQTATKWNNLGIALDIAYQDTNGDNSRRINADLQSTLDGVLGTHASLAPGALSTRYKILDTHLIITGEQLQVNLWNWHSSDAGVGVGAAQALDPNGRDDSDLWMTDLTYHLNLGGSEWDNSVRFSYLHYKELARFNIFPAGTVLPIGNDGNINFMTPSGIVQFPDGLLGNPGGLAKDVQLDFISIFSGWDSHRVRFAVGTRYRSLEPNESKNFGPGVIDGSAPVVDGELTNVSKTPYVFLADSSRRIRYLSLQDEWQIVTDLALTTGLRYDDYSDFGSTTNPRIALVWAASDALTTKLLYGSAFRAPSFSELGFKNNPVSLGNPDLKPEKIDTVELSFNYKVNPNLQSTLTLFNYKAKDMIEYLPDQSTTTTTAQNARDQDGKGFEWEVSWKPLPKLRLSSSYAMQDATDSKTHSDISDAPGHQINVNVNWEFYADWFLNGQMDLVADRHRAAGDLRKPVEDYTLVNFTLRRKNIIPDLDMSIVVRNATNTDAREPSSGTIAEDYPLESRSAWIELNYSFR